MVSVKGFEVRAKKLIEKFDHLQTNEKICIGALDSEIAKFFVDALTAMIEHYEDDDFYFGVVVAVGDFVYELSDMATAYRVWCELDFGKINSFEFGSRAEMKQIVEAKEFYSL